MYEKQGGAMTTATTTEAKPKRQMEKFSVEMSSDAVNLVDSMKDRLDKRSRADVFRASVLVLKFLLDSIDKGYSLALVKEDENGEQRIIKAFEFMV